MSGKELTKLLNRIEKMISSAGYNPRDQLYGYYITNNDMYITSKGNARTYIKQVPIEFLEEYLKNKYPELII